MKLDKAASRMRAARYWLTAGALAASGSAHAVNFQMFDGEVEGSFDTTVSAGMQLRTEKADPKQFGNQFGNRALFQKKWDIFSAPVKASHDLALSGSGWNVFLRGNYFYDFVMAAEKEQLPSASENRAVKHGDITDAYFLTRLGGSDQFTVRLGKQVISWGENTFIGGSLNDINTVDITKLRQPGVELKDALVGTPAAHFAWQVTDAFTLEAFALFGYDELKADPMGGFFGTLDVIADGGGFGNAVDGLGRAICVAPDGSTCHLGLGTIPVARSADNIPSSGGQYGVALRYFAPALGNGFDFGLYYQNLHDHNPQLSSVAGTNPLQPGTFVVDYAKDVERFGASFNTIVGSWALGGEYSYRRNAPIQGTDFLVVAATGADLGGNAFAPGTKFQGFERYERHQIQLTTQRLWGPMPMLFGADQWNTIGEIAYGWADDVPGVDIDGRTGGQPLGALAAAQQAGGGFLRFDDITKDFWGFQARSTLTYNNILFNRINMDFNTAFRWDVEGVSPELGGAKLFLAGRKVLSVGVNFDYALRWRVGINQTFVFNDDGRKRPNGSIMNSGTDRDFLSFDVSYTF